MIPNQQNLHNPHKILHMYCTVYHLTLFEGSLKTFKCAFTVMLLTLSNSPGCHLIMQKRVTEIIKYLRLDYSGPHGTYTICCKLRPSDLSIVIHFAQDNSFCNLTNWHVILRHHCHVRSWGPSRARCWTRGGTMWCILLKLAFHFTYLKQRKLGSYLL
jgi:hypothetical protein